MGVKCFELPAVGAPSTAPSGFAQQVGFRGAKQPDLAGTSKDTSALGNSSQ